MSEERYITITVSTNLIFTQLIKLNKEYSKLTNDEIFDLWTECDLLLGKGEKYLCVADIVGEKIIGEVCQESILEDEDDLVCVESYQDEE